MPRMWFPHAESWREWKEEEMDGTGEAEDTFKDELLWLDGDLGRL